MQSRRLWLSISLSQRPATHDLAGESIVPYAMCAARASWLHDQTEGDGNFRAFFDHWTESNSILMQCRFRFHFSVGYSMYYKLLEIDSLLSLKLPREFDELTLKYTRNSSIRNKTMKWTASGERTNKVDNKLESSIKQTEKDAMKTKLSVWLTH